MRQEIKDFFDFQAGEIIDNDNRWYCLGVDWDNLEQEDYEAVIGAACMYAYLIGTRPTISDLSDYIEVPREKIKAPFQRLLQSGVFSKAYNARNDSWLNLLSKKPHDRTKTFCAWGYIAGIASNAITRNYSNMNIKAMD